MGEVLVVIHGLSCVVVFSCILVKNKANGA
jgi:hypothetical protein